MVSLLLAAGVEIVVLVLIVAFAAGCAYPIYDIIAHDFVIIIIVMALLCAFYFRLVVFFRQTAWLKYFALQIILFFLNPVMFLKVLGKFQDMIFLFDAHDLAYFIAPGSAATIYEMNDTFQLFRKEFLLLAVGLLILIVFTEFRIAMAFVKRIREME